MSKQVFDTDNKYEVVTGFSTRLNALLDKCDYPPAGNGRGSQLARFFNASKASVSNWLSKDNPPPWATLNTLVEKLLACHRLNYHQGRLVAWLMLSSDTIENPLESAEKPQSGRLLDALIYSELEKISQQYTIDIFSFNNQQFSALYEKTLAYFLEHKLTAPEHIREADKLILAGYMMLSRG